MNTYGDSTAKKTDGNEAVLSPDSRDPKSTESDCISVVSSSGLNKPKASTAVVSSPWSIKLNAKPADSSSVPIGVSMSDKANGKSVVTSVVPTTPTRSVGISSGIRGKAAVSSGFKGKAAVSDEGGYVLSFRDVTVGPHEGEIRFRLIHFWEARNALTKKLIGLEMLLIDQEGNVLQGFIPPVRIGTYLPHMVAGAVYRLNKFFGSKNKTQYRVTDAVVTVSFSLNSVLSVLEDTSVSFPKDRYRFHGHPEFEAACDLKGDLYDFIGHIKLVNGQTMNDNLVLDEAEIASTQRVLLHVQTHDGPVMKIYLWDHAASAFREKIKASENPPRVILVTTLNPKRYGGVLSLSSMAPSRVFVDNDVQATRDYLTWLSSNLDIAERVNADVMTKTETVTIEELFSYMKQATAKVAWFECTATIDDVVQGGGWYYIGCAQCHTKATKRPRSLMCKKCGKNEIIGVPQYLTKISVYDSSDQAIFVLLGDAGQELTGKKASELVDSYVEANEVEAEDLLIPLPQTLLDTIGQTCRFIVKVSNHNLTGKTQSLTVTKVLLPKAPEPEVDIEDEVTVPEGNKTLQLGDADDGPSTVHEESADETLKRCTDAVEEEEPKRVKRG